VRSRTLVATLLAAAVAGCGACDQPPSDALEDCSTSVVLPGSVKTDILFVIDDSGSMSQEQTLLQNGLANFIQALASSPVANQFQIGVTTTSVADFSGATVAPAGDLVDPILLWSSVNLVSDFQSQVAVGTVGSGREQPFEAAKRALLKSTVAGSPNEGLLRPGARLAIIFLTDEDDCSGLADGTITNDLACQEAAGNPASSLVKVSDFAAFLNGPISGEVRDVVVAAITGVTCTGGLCSATPKCSTALSSPNRIVEMLSVLPSARTRLASICDPSFDDALASFADAILSQTLPLDGAVADYRLLGVKVTKPNGSEITCPVIGDAEPLTSTVGAFYEAPRGGHPASLTFLNDCALDQGDAVSVNVVCVR
jgi:hypothetical protein